MASYEQAGHTVKVPTIPVSVHAAREVADGTAALAAAHRAKAHKVSRPPSLGENNAEILRELGIAPTSSPAPESE
jgi:crotonobetainyl-CoA:carnitine CoA-transferase CaiB-like acyl-CoA transferase